MREIDDLVQLRDNLTGTWKPFGRYVKKNPQITIQGQELTFWIGMMRPEPKQTTVHFHLEEGRSLRENHCYNIIIDEEQYKNMDFMVHEETIEGKQVVILSHMGMEYDGRGRIVMASYIREEEYALVNDEFKSLAYQYWNDCPSVPMMQTGPSGNDFMGMKLGMMPGMMSGMTAGMMPSMTAGMVAVTPSPVSQVEPWDCSCGNKQITGKFCPECGMPMPEH